jgi:hypothetical protein
MDFLRRLIKQTSPEVPPSADGPQQMQTTDARLLLLSKFLQPQLMYDFTKSDEWKQMLDQDPGEAIHDLIDEGMLIEPEVHACLAFRFKVLDLKQMLKARGLPASGRKDDLIERLVSADPEAMRQETVGLNIWQCSDRGRTLAEKYVSDQRQKRTEAERYVFEQLSKRNLKEANRVVTDFKAAQAFPRRATEESSSKPDQVEMLTIIFQSKPKILATLTKNSLEVLQLAAAMIHLWGDSAKEWLPSDLKTGLAMDNDTAARMVLFYAYNQSSLTDYRRNKDILRGVEILDAVDSCRACRKLSHKTYTFGKVPELPYENCTSEKGCRCTYAPSLRDQELERRIVSR